MGAGAAGPAPPSPASWAADRVVVDSDRLGRALDDGDLAALRDQPAIDLAWVRLHPWRRLLADAFAAHELSPMVRGVERADIVGGVPWSALVGGWLTSRLDLAPANVRLVAGDRRAVHLWAQLPGRRAEVSAAVVGDHRVRVATVADGVERHHVVGLPAASLAADVGVALDGRVRSRPGMGARRGRRPGARRYAVRHRGRQGNVPRTSASATCSASMTCITALISARWVNACGKLPRWRPLRGSISSA